MITNMKKILSTTFILLVAVILLLIIPRSALFAQTAQEIENKILAEADANIEKYRKGDAIIQIVDTEGNPVPNASVSVKQISHDFLFGCNVTIITGELGEVNPIKHYGGKHRFTTEEQVKEYKAKFAELFNFATVPFYWASLEPVQGKPKYQYADKVIEWCLKKGIVVKGHTLVWTNQDGIPSWFKNYPPDEQKILLEKHVKNTVSRYKGKVKFWDVVNEAAWNNNTLAGMSMRDYVNEPLKWARQIVPNTFLSINDAHHLDNFSRMERLFKIISDINQADYDVIGFQAHVDVTDRFRLEIIAQMLEKYSKLGKTIHVTEFTPPSEGRPITKSWKTGNWTEKEQADYVTIFYKFCFSLPYVESIGWWDLCDYGSWQSYGGLLREDLSPKPAYNALKKLIHSDWHTEKDSKTDEYGNMKFRGFHGKYNVTTTAPDETTRTVTIHLKKDSESQSPLLIFQIRRGLWGDLQE